MKIRAIDHVVLTVRDVGRTLSFYFRDPDGNLIEVANEMPS